MSAFTDLPTWLQDFEVATNTRAAALLLPTQASYGEPAVARRLLEFTDRCRFSCGREDGPGEGWAFDAPCGWRGWASPIRWDGALLGLAGVAAVETDLRSLTVRSRCLAAALGWYLKQAQASEERLNTLQWVGWCAHCAGASDHFQQAEHVFSSFLTQALREAGAASGSLILVNPATNQPFLVSSSGLSEQAGDGTPEPSVASAVLQGGRPTLLTDLSRDLEVASIVPRQDVHSAMSIPIRNQEKTIAVLNLNRNQEPGFAAQDLERMAAWAAKHGAVVWLVSRLYELRQKEVELSLLKALNPGARHLMSDLSDRLREVVSQIVPALHVSFGLARLAAGGRAWLAAFPAGADAVEYNALAEAIGCCLASGDLLIEPDLHRRRRLPAEAAVPKGSRCCLAVASEDSGTQVLLAVFGAGPRAFSLAEVQLLNLAAGSIAAEATARQLHQDLVEHRSAVLTLSRKVVQAQEEERLRMALELHDEVSQSLSSLCFRIQTLDQLLKGGAPNIREELENISGAVRQTLDKVVRMMYRLRPAALDRFGLFVSLRQLVRHFTTETGITGHLKISGQERRLPPDVELGVYRIVQEALQNVRKHSGASEVHIPVTVTEDRIEGAVHDNGTGFPPESLFMPDDRSRWGLVGMRERAKLLGGSFSIGASGVHRGALIRFSIPLRGAAEDWRRK